MIDPGLKDLAQKTPLEEVETAIALCEYRHEAEQVAELKEIKTMLQEASKITPEKRLAQRIAKLREIQEKVYDQKQKARLQAVIDAEVKKLPAAPAKEEPKAETATTKPQQQPDGN